MNNQLAVIIAILTLLFFLRFDFAFTLLPYKVQSGDTLWGIVNQKVIKNNQLTALVIKHLRISYPLIDWNHLESNNLDGTGGYIVSIWLNKLTLQASDGRLIVSDVPLLPPWALGNHFLMVLVHNVVLIALTLYAFITLKANKFVVNSHFLRQLMIDPTLLGFLIVVIGSLAFFAVVSIIYLFLTMARLT